LKKSFNEADHVLLRAGFARFAEKVSFLSTGVQEGLCGVTQTAKKVKRFCLIV
jgi:hypothetical protein